MDFEEGTIKNLESALSGLADVFGVGLVITDEKGKAITQWQYPSDMAKLTTKPDIKPITEIEYLVEEAGIIKNEDGKRRFVVPIPEINKDKFFVQSDELPEHFAWIDGKLRPQVLPGYETKMTDKPAFLLGLFISNVCVVVVKKRSSLPQINDLDIENIHRIGVSFRKKINCEQDKYRSASFSLEAMPSLEVFFSVPTLVEQPTIPVDLTEIFERITTDTQASFNLMSLNGNFVVKGTDFQPICKDFARKHYGNDCFESDVSCLIEATLTRKAKEGVPDPRDKKCYLGFTETFAPVFVNGLIVGLVFGGQLIENLTDCDKIVELCCRNKNNSGKTKASHKFKPNRNGEIERSKKIVSGLSALIEPMFDRYCVSENLATLGRELAHLRTDNQREIFRKACFLIKRFLTISECSAFRLVGDNLILEATTSEKVKIRQKPKGPARIINRNEAIGKVYYQIGEGLTGSVIKKCESRFEPDAMRAKDWAGKCSEISEPAQFFGTPIVHGNKCYGVLRAAKYLTFYDLLKTHQKMIERFAEILGIVLHNYELSQAEKKHFDKKTKELQSLLAEAAHEYRSPLHAVLSLSTAIQYTQDIEKLKGLHQRIKEEVYRAKRIMDNYLIRGVTGREELKYNFELNNLYRLVKECVSRFKLSAAKKGIEIKVDYWVSRLPKLVFDYDRIEQALTNIIDNAVKYAFDDTEVLITAKEKTNTVTVSLTDMGLGIPKEAEKQIFEGYQRTVEDKHRFKPGTGLGLKIALEIIKAHEGSIYIESKPVWSDPKRLALHEGYETKFIISLPKDSPQKRS